MMLEFERDPLFKIHDMHDLSVPQQRERTMEKVSADESIVHHVYSPLWTSTVVCVITFKLTG